MGGLHLVELQRGLVVILLLQAYEFLFQLGRFLFGAGLSVEVVELVGVVVQVVEFPRVDVAIEVDELPAVRGAHAVVALHAVLGWVLVVMVIHAFAPVFGVLALQQRP